MVNPFTVVSSRFLASNTSDLTIVRKPWSLSGGNFTVTDEYGRIMFKVKGKLFSLNGQKVLLDAAGNRILSFQRKFGSLHTTWVAFKGDSKVQIFSAKKSSVVQFNTSLDVFLGCRSNQNVCDFKVKGSWFEKSCTVYAGDGRTVVAQMHKNNSVASVLGKDRFSIKVYRNVDHAFIVALVVVLDQINRN